MKNKELDSLVKRLKTKDEDAFEEMYHKLWKVIYYLAYRYLNNSESAKDITQEVFIIIYQKIGELKDGIAFNAWMNRIVINQCHNYKNSISKQNYIDIDIINDELIEDNMEFLPVELLNDKNKRMSVIEEISNLPEELKIVVLLYYFEELPIAQIAETLDIVNSAVYKRLMKARQILKVGYEEKYGTEMVYSSISSVAVLTLLLQENSQIVCVEVLEKSIYSNIKANIKITNSRVPDGISNAIVTKIIIGILVIGASIGGYFILKDNTNKPDLLPPQIEKKEEIRLETFVGDDNAKLIKSWKSGSTRENNASLVKIMKESDIPIDYYYVEPTTREVYVLYKKVIDNQMLILVECNDSDNKIWGVVYQVVDASSQVVTKEEIKVYFDKLEK